MAVYIVTVEYEVHADSEDEARSTNFWCNELDDDGTVTGVTEAKTPPTTLNRVGRRGRVIAYNEAHYLILGLSAAEPVWTVVRPNPEVAYGQSDWETDRIDGTAVVEVVDRRDHGSWVEDAADYFCVELEDN